MLRTLWYFKDSFLFFLYDPLPQVLSASGGFIRLTASGIFDWRDHAVLKKDYPWSGCLEKLPDPSIIFYDSSFDTDLALCFSSALTIKANKIEVEIIALNE